MNINDMTIGEAKEVLKLLSNTDNNNTTDLYNESIGKYVLIRSRNEGVNAGFLTKADETGCVLSEARRLHYHKPKDANLSWYEGISISGLDSSSRVSCSVSTKIIVEDYSITLCTEVSQKSIVEFKTHESN